MTIIDFHNHYYPPEYIDAVSRGPSNIKVTTDGDGNPVLHSPGDENIVVPGHRDAAYRARVLEEAGIDRQVITFTAPGTLIEEPGRSLELARLANDCLAAVAREWAHCFSALGTLPLNHPEGSLVEFERATADLGFKGFMLFSNANGVPLWDERFHAIYRRAHETGTVLYIHPTYPVGVEFMQDYWLMPLVGFLFDTTLAAAGLVLSGVVERYPGIRWVLGHLGGAIPYLAERLDRGYEAFAECREHLSREPSSYLREFYYDTVNFDPKALRLALDFAGPGHLLAGSDYPHRIGSLGKMIDSIDRMGLDDTDRRAILGGNAAGLLNEE